MLAQWWRSGDDAVDANLREATEVVRLLIVLLLVLTSYKGVFREY